MTSQTEHPKGSPMWLVAQASQLEGDRKEIMNRISANRELLRSLDKVGALDADSAKFVHTFYPSKVRGQARSQEEVISTRKLRALAHQGG